MYLYNPHHDEKTQDRGKTLFLFRCLTIMFLKIKYRYDGNTFSNSPAPPPPPYNPPPPGRTASNRTRPSSGTNSPKGSDGNTSDSDKGLKTGVIVAIIVGSVFLGLVLVLTFCFCYRKNKKPKTARASSVGSQSAPRLYGVCKLICECIFRVRS